MTITNRVAHIDKVVAENEVTLDEIKGYVASLPAWELIVFEEAMRQLRAKVSAFALRLKVKR
jgi:hypothetical protein